MNKVLQRIARWVEAAPDRIAYQNSAQSITYGELWHEAEITADLLCRQGTGPVLLYGNKEADLVISMLACLMAGRVYVPLHHAAPLARIRKIASLTGSDLLLSRAALEIEGITCCNRNALSMFQEQPKLSPPGDIAYMIFTSGSTGDPKGVPISPENLESFVRWISAFPPLSDYRACCVMNQASFSFDLSVADLYYALCNGHTLVALDRDVSKDYNAIFIPLAKANVAVMTPTFMKLCLMEPSFCAENYPALKCVYFCGEPLEPKTVRHLLTAFPSLCVINAYGPTEATSAVSAIRITKEMAADEKILPVGRADAFATEISITDGEIVLKGDSVFGGYLGGIPGGHYTENGVNCYRTGDLGCIKNGLLYCSGRMDSQIKWKGYRIELGEIEAQLDRLPQVDACAVVAKRSPDGSVKSIHAFVVPGCEVEGAALQAKLGETLPSYMIPRVIEFVDALPVNQNGKTDRKALSKR